MMHEYPTANLDLLHLFESEDFDAEYASKLINEMENIDAPICAANGYSTTYLYEAQASDNVEAVKLILDKGADPNLYRAELICSCALWELQYLQFGKDDGKSKNRYEIAKLFFMHGADPNLECDGETLFDYVVFKVYNDCESGPDFKYLLDFYKLLVVYGGGINGKGYGKPLLSEAVKPERVDEYTIQLYLCEDNYHVMGYLVDSNGKRLGKL